MCPARHGSGHADGLLATPQTHLPGGLESIGAQGAIIAAVLITVPEASEQPGVLCLESTTKNEYILDLFLFLMLYL